MFGIIRKNAFVIGKFPDIFPLQEETFRKELKEWLKDREIVLDCVSKNGMILESKSIWVQC